MSYYKKCFINVHKDKYKIRDIMGDNTN